MEGVGYSIAFEQGGNSVNELVNGRYPDTIQLEDAGDITKSGKGHQGLAAFDKPKGKDGGYVPVDIHLVMDHL